MNKIPSTIIPYNLILNSKYIVYLNRHKFDRNRYNDSSIISLGDSNFDHKRLINLLLSWEKPVILTDERRYLDFYADNNYQDLKTNPQFSALSKIKEVESDHGISFDKSDQKDYEMIVKFSLDYLNSLYFLDLQSKKTFISYNSYYLTNFVTKTETDSYPVVLIDSNEILNRLSVDFDSQIEDLLEEVDNPQ